MTSASTDLTRFLPPISTLWPTVGSSWTNTTSLPSVRHLGVPWWLENTLFTQVCGIVTYKLAWRRIGTQPGSKVHDVRWIHSSKGWAYSRLCLGKLLQDVNYNKDKVHRVVFGREQGFNAKKKNIIFFFRHAAHRTFWCRTSRTASVGSFAATVPGEVGVRVSHSRQMAPRQL